jgi:hypothetical protein
VRSAARKWDPDLLAAIAGIGAVPALGLMAVDHDPFAGDQERVGSQPDSSAAIGVHHGLQRSQ